MEKCPCLDCITFPICKTQIKFSNDNTFYSVEKLISKCKPFFEWWREEYGEQRFKDIYHIKYNPRPFPFRHKYN